MQKSITLSYYDGYSVDIELSPVDALQHKLTITKVDTTESKSRSSKVEHYLNETQLHGIYFFLKDYMHDNDI